MSLAELENSIGYKFKNKKLLDEAITHKSVNSDFNNERLEFLGDSVISLVVSEALHFEESSLDEGKLSIYRSRIVSRSSLSRAGLKIKLNKYNAVVIALKTRTVPIKKAISESIKALEWLKSKKCKKIVFKYCSTFDSTKKGNIGPVIDAIMKNLNVDFTICLLYTSPSPRD